MTTLSARIPLIASLRREFAGYSRAIFQRDLLAGLTVGAVALPLALAFGVASGADAAAGIVTAIIAGIVIALLGGAPFQISGPTGAMSAILIGLAQHYGLGGVWGRQRDGGRVSAPAWAVSFWPLYRVHSIAGDHWLHQRHCPDHRDRPDPQCAGDRRAKDR